MYEVGQIFTDDEEYSKISRWCNNNSCYIEEIEQNEDCKRQFQIKEIIAPKKSEEQKLNELATTIRTKRNSLLAETDYLLMPDYPISQENLEKVKEYRQQLRDITKQDEFPTKVTFPELEEI